MNAANEPTMARDVVGHAIPTPKVPVLPTLIRPLPQKPLQAETLDDIARHVHQLRGQRGLRIGPVSHASYGGSDTFPGFALFAIDPLTNAEDYIGFAAIQKPTAGALEDALRRTEAQKAAA